MRTIKLVAPATAAKLTTLLPDWAIYCKAVFFQAPTGNTGVVYFGSSTTPLFEAPTGLLTLLPAGSLNNIYIQGSGSNYINVGVIY